MLSASQTVHTHVYMMTLTFRSHEHSQVGKHLDCVAIQSNARYVKASSLILVCLFYDVLANM